MARKVTIRRGLKADLPLLDIGELGFAIDTMELYIGSETGNILFAKKSELDSINAEINGIKESVVFTRLGISTNGLLTIDGVEQVNTGGGEEMTLIVKDFFEGSTNITKTYTEDMIGFDITNDHSTTGLTFTINGLTIPVKASETYSANFAPYKSLTITTTVPYRATVSAKYIATQPDTTAPNNVTGLTTSNITTTGLTLSWNASTSTDTTGYEVYRGTTLLTTVTGTTYNVTSLSANTSYTFTVKAKDGSNNISTGTSVTVSTLAPDVTPPNEVTNLATSNITATSLTLSWTASTSSDIASYEVYNGSTLLSTVTGTTYNVGSLVASTAYTFTVKSKDASNNISIGVSVSATTTNVVDTTAPSPISGLTVGTVTSTSIPITWTLSPSSDVANQEVAYSSDGGATYTVASGVVNPSSTSYTINGLTASTNYTIRVVAIDSSNNRSTAVTATATTSAPADTTPPENVTNLTSSSITQTGVTLTWTASTSTDVASYDILNGTTLLGNVTGTTYNVTGLTAGTSYTFWVKAKDTNGNIASGTSVNVTTLAADTTAPTVTVSPAGGTYTSSQSVTLTSNETATIYYTLDGSTPTESSSVYSSALNITATTTLKYFAKDTAGNSSAVQTATYTINTDTTAPTLTITPATTFTNTQTVTMSTNETATIYYTLDGSAPTTSSSVYSSALTLSATTTVKAFAKDTAGNESTVQTVTYTKEVALNITDAFTRADSTTSLGTSDTGQTWEALSGTWGISGNQAYLASDSTASLAVIDTGKTDITVSTDIIFGTNGGLALKVTDVNNYLFLRLNKDASFERVELYSFSGTATLLNSYNTTLVAGTTYNLKAQINGSTISCYLNGTKIMESYSVLNPTATKYGIRQNNTTSDKYDNFLIVDSPSIMTTHTASDTFNRTNSSTSLGTSSSGHTWSTLTGSVGISDNRAYNSRTTTNTSSLAVLDAGVSNAEIEVVKNIFSSGGIAFRASDAQNYYFFRYSTVDQKWQLYKSESGTLTKLLETTAEAITGSTIKAYKLKVVVNGSSIECFVDGVSKLSTTNTFNQTATKYGLRDVTHGTDLTKVEYYDNFTVKAI